GGGRAVAGEGGRAGEPARRHELVGGRRVGRLEGAGDLGRPRFQTGHVGGVLEEDELPPYGRRRRRRPEERHERPAVHDPGDGRAGQLDERGGKVAVDREVVERTARRHARAPPDQRDGQTTHDV